MYKVVDQISLRTFKKGVLVTSAILVIATAYHLLGCPIRLVFGIPCPGCGMTRAWLLAIRLRFAGAFNMHPLFLLAPPLILLAFSSRRRRAGEVGLTVIIVAFLITYVVRMVYMFPDTDPMLFNPNGIVQRVFNFRRSFL